MPENIKQGKSNMNCYSEFEGIQMNTFSSTLIHNASKTYNCQ